MNSENELLTEPTIQIAYAEDHKLVRKTVIDYMLRLGGMEFIIEADNGNDLIAQLENATIFPEICLIDITMPKMNGFETVSFLKRRWPDLKLIALSGHQTEEYIVKMILAGADGYLTKNADPLEIKAAIFDVHEFGWHNTEMLTKKFISSIRNGKFEVPNLTGKEIQLLKCSIEDLTFDEIAAKMNSTPKSIEGHRGRLYSKLNIKTRAGLAMYAVRYGYVAIEQGSDSF